MSIFAKKMQKIGQCTLTESGQFGKLFLDYVAQKKELMSFYQAVPNLENFSKQIALKQDFPLEQRKVLAEQLGKQYVSIPETNHAQIASLADPNTFCVTTGHQLCFLGGPLYFVTKILTTINTCEQLKKAYPDKHFVPIFWLASEDHDFEEIASVSVFNKKYNLAHQPNQHAVGRLSASLAAEALEQIPDLPAFLKACYAPDLTLSQATFRFVHALFGKYGLLVIEPDHVVFKQYFRSVAAADMFENRTYEAVKECNESLEVLGYKPQVSARHSNLFLLTEDGRFRLDKHPQGHFVLNDTQQTAYTQEDLETIIAHQPEKISPNVCLRPVYQEIILPNLGYVGGPGELAYWLSLQGVFNANGVVFPLLLQRAFVFPLLSNQNIKLEKLGFHANDLFKETQELKKAYLQRQGDISIDQQKALIFQAFEQIVDKGARIEKSLVESIWSEHRKVEKIVENLQKRIEKAEQGKHQNALLQIEQIYQKLFPDGVMLERKESFLTYFINNPAFIEEIKEVIEPFSTQIELVVC